MEPSLYKVELIGSGFLAIMPRPRVSDWAEEEFSGFFDAGIRRIISLLEVHEEFVLGLEHEATYCADAHIAFGTFPIPDRGVPGSPQELSKLSWETYLGCAGGDSTAVHCRAGIGRSSLFAAAVLLHAGYSVDDAFARIQQARGIEVPDTEEQALWLHDHTDTVLQAKLA